MAISSTTNGRTSRPSAASGDPPKRRPVKPVRSGVPISAPARNARRASKESAQDGRERAVRPPRYPFREFEARWRTEWERRGLYRVDLDHAARPYYNLMMFPYPSAEGLHIGNMYAYVGSDIHGRLMAMRGYDVFEPMGFDAFGIHSENFAIKRGAHPAEMTARNVERFRETQLKRIGARFDWSAEVNSTDPAYYRWTQWIFIQLFKMGLAERKTGVVNWCPHDLTVLADEQVIDGRCERCGTVVERRALPHWALRITKYADRLLDHLDSLDWSERVKAAQRNWIGRSTGVEFSMPVVGQPETAVTVFTTRPETAFGVTFVVMAPAHPLVERIVSPTQRGVVAQYQAGAAARRAERERQRSAPTSVAASAMTTEDAPTGVFTGAYAINPVNGERIPIWVADYVLMDYGSGAIMATPAHDERDWDFAHTMGLPIRVVVVPESEVIAQRVASDHAFEGEGVMVASGEYTGMRSEVAREAITGWFERSGAGHRLTRYHLRDWLISRQRYWGPPIPIIYCPEHGAVPVPEADLPVRLPPLEDYRPQGTGDSPLSRVPTFVQTTCPVCGGPARRDTDVMDNFLDSAWYYLRYPSAHDDTRAWDPERTRRWLPVQMYVGGAEHSVLHLLYARFIAMAMHDAGYLDFEEPFTRFHANGMITQGGAKMSKSAGNIVNPDQYIDAYGADALRVHLIFLGPYERDSDFQARSAGGVVRFLERIWRLMTERAIVSHEPSRAERRALLQTVQKVSADTEVFKYNTAVAELMRYSNTLEPRDDLTREEAETLLRLLAPYAPYLAEELWSRVGAAGSVHQQPWPVTDDATLAAVHADTVTVVAQVNGKVRARLRLPVGANQAETLSAALAAEGVARALAGRPPDRVVFLPDRLINITVRAE